MSPFAFASDRALIVAMMIGTNHLLALGLAGVAALSACSGDPAGAGVEVIEGELADQIGLGELEAECDEPDDRDVGTEFTCTATTEDDEVVELNAVFDAEDEVFVYPTNILLDSEMSTVEAEAAQVLGAEIGVEVDPADIECPVETMVLGADGILDCTITDPATGDRFALTATFGDHVRDEGFQERNYAIGEEAI